MATQNLRKSGLIIDGHEVTWRQWRGFSAFVRADGNILKAAQESNINRLLFYQWRLELWWNVLIDQLEDIAEWRPKTS